MKKNLSFLRKKLNLYNVLRLNLVALILLVCFACKKSEDRTCFKTTGKRVTKVYSVGNYTLLKLHPYISYTLVPDSINYVEVSCGENLINFIKLDCQDSLLTISNENKCDFLRDLDRKIEVKIHIRKLNNLYFDGTERVVCSDTLNSDFLTVLLKDGAGTVDLIVNTISLDAQLSNGSGNYILSGLSAHTKISLSDKGFCDASKLVTKDSLRFNTTSFGDLKINASEVYVLGDIYNTGNVYYYGTPSLTKIMEWSSGRFIQK